VSMITREVKEFVIYATPDTTEDKFKEEFKYRNMDVISIKKDIPIFVDKTLEKHGYIPFLVKVLAL
jgi:hypothetical protein